MQWVIWYSDGKTFSSSDGGPEAAPRWGVVCIVGYDRTGSRSIQHQRDYYCWTEQWLGMDHTGLIDYLANTDWTKIVLMGRAVSNHEFYRVFERANVDPRTPA